MFTDSVDSSMLAASISIPRVDIKDAFFQDLEDHVGPLVRNSLFLYAAYLRKAIEVAKYREDPKADVPYLKREAELRKVPLKDMVAMVEAKGEAFNKALSEMELLRVEFNLRYAGLKEYQERLELRDEFIPRIGEVMSLVG